MLQTETLQWFLEKQSGPCPNRGILQFEIPLFSHYSNKNMLPSVENFLIRSYPRFASTTTTTTANVHSTEFFFPYLSSYLLRIPSANYKVIVVSKDDKYTVRL